MARSRAKRKNSEALEFGGTFELDWRAGEFADMTWRAAQGVLREMTEKVVEQARENVAPGKGPKPHVNEEKSGIHVVRDDDGNVLFYHVDSGNLAESVTSSIGDKKGYLQASVWSDTTKTDGIPYGMYLELGFEPTKLRPPHDKVGSFYRYPWLSPAMLQVAEDYKGMMPTRFRSHLHDAIARSRKKKSLKVLRPITELGSTMARISVYDRILTSIMSDIDAYGYDGREEVDEGMVRDLFRNKKR